MSLGNKKMNSNVQNKQSSSWASKYEIEPQGYVDEVDERFFGENTPNEPPLLQVEVKLAADISISDNPRLVREVAEFWFPDEVQRYKKVAIIAFNDASVWHIPLASWEKDYENFRRIIVEEFIPDVVQWKAIVDNRSPSKALSKWNEWLESDDEGWEEDMEKTKFSKENREWFNENADWLGHILRQVDTKDRKVSLDVEDSWENDW
jgi:hypothetical protein